MIKNIFLTLIAFSFLVAEANHIIFSRITTTPDDAEMVAIYNPTSEAINLSNYYLSDEGSYYYNLPSNDNYWSESDNDFIARFPDIDIESHQTLTIGFHDIASFNNHYSINPDFSLQEDMLSVSNDTNTIGSDNNILSNNFESLILFYWDGSSLIIQDVDYFVWGFAQAGIDKTGIGGGNPGIDGYYDDTSFDDQNLNILGYHTDGESYIRNSSTENGEAQENGNGYTGHDETSEVFIDSWDIVIENGCFVADCGCLIPEDPNYDENAAVSCLDADDNGYGDCCAANIITHTIEDIVTGDDDGFVATIRGIIIGFGDYREPNNGPQVIELMDSETGHVIDLVIWDWDVITPIPSSIAYMVDPSNLTEYAILATGLVGIYQGSFQFEITDESDIEEYYAYNPQGEFFSGVCENAFENDHFDCEELTSYYYCIEVDIDDDGILDCEWNPYEEVTYVKIIPAPFVIIPTLGERLDYSFSVPSNSKVVIRIFDMNGNFVTSLLDDFFESSGVVERFEDQSDWDGTDHHGQIVAPGTYLMHIEATNWISGKYSYDMAPIVVGVYK